MQTDSTESGAPPVDTLTRIITAIAADAVRHCEGSPACLLALARECLDEIEARATKQHFVGGHTDAMRTLVLVPMHDRLEAASVRGSPRTQAYVLGYIAQTLLQSAVRSVPGEVLEPARAA